MKNDHKNNFALGIKYRGADKSLARPGRKQARKHVRDVRDFNNIKTRAVKFPPPPCKAPKEIHAILTETLACFLPDLAKDLSAPLCSDCRTNWFMERHSWRINATSRHHTNNEFTELSAILSIIHIFHSHHPPPLITICK